MSGPKKTFVRQSGDNVGTVATKLLTIDNFLCTFEQDCLRDQMGKVCIIWFKLPLFGQM
jgi:hypothetical protein